LAALLLPVFICIALIFMTNILVVRTKTR